MNKYEIKKPIWGTREIGIADFRLSDDLEIIISYKNKDGEKIYPHTYFIKREKALTYPTQNWKGVNLHIIPIEDLEVINKSLARKRLDSIKEYFIKKGIFTNKHPHRSGE